MVEWTNVDMPERYAESVLVELRDGDRLVHREDLFRRGLGARSGGDRTHATYPLTFEAPVETREYDLTIELTLRRRGPGDTIERVQRRIHLGAAKVARLSEPRVASHGSAELARTSTIERALERAAGWADPRRVGLVAIGVVVLIAGGVVVGRRRRRSS